MTMDNDIRQLVNGVLCPSFEGTTLPDWVAEELRHGLGGIFYFGLNLDLAPDAVDTPAALSASIHALNDDCLIWSDEEGGIVSRLESDGGSQLPGSMVLGRLDDVALTEAAHTHIGTYCRAAGVDVAAGPDVDVNCNPRNPVIGVRSFGATPELVSRHAAAAVRGLQATGVAACTKHFPGHGDTAVDSHLGLPVLDMSMEELREVHLPPFQAAIDAGVQTMMSAHIVVKALGDLPGTLNPKAVAILREMGFDGVLCSDALDMHAISRGIGVGQGAVLAIKAGLDLLCIGYPELGTTPEGGRADEAQYRRVFDALYAAVANGEIPRERLEEAIARRLRVRAWGRSVQAVAAAQESPSVDWDAATARAFEVLGDVALGEGDVLMVDARGGNRAAGPLPDMITVTLRTAGRTVERMAVVDEATATAAVAAAAAWPTPNVVVEVNQPQSAASEAALLEALLPLRPDAVVVRVGLADEKQWAPRELRTFGMSRPTASAVARTLLH